MLWWNEVWGFSWSLGSKDGQRESGHWPLMGVGTELVSHAGQGWCFYPARRSSAITNVKDRSSFLLWHSKKQAKKVGTAHLGWYRMSRTAVGFWGRTVFSLIPHFTACFWHKEAKVYSLAVYVARPPTLKETRGKSKRKDRLILWSSPGRNVN